MVFRRNNRGSGAGIFLLAYQLFWGLGLREIPPVTLASVILQAGMFLKYISPHDYGPHSAVCLHASDILNRGESYRLFWGHLEHASDLHLYYNMLSFMYKGRILEPVYGSAPFAGLLLTLMALSGILYTGLAQLASEVRRKNYKHFWTFKKKDLDVLQILEDPSYLSLIHI